MGIITVIVSKGESIARHSNLQGNSGTRNFCEQDILAANKGITIPWTFSIQSKFSKKKKKPKNLERRQTMSSWETTLLEKMYTVMILSADFTKIYSHKLEKRNFLKCSKTRDGTELTLKTGDPNTVIVQHIGVIQWITGCVSHFYNHWTKYLTETT
jgi:hypothetical protein